MLINYNYIKYRIFYVRRCKNLEEQDNDSIVNLVDDQKSKKYKENRAFSMSSSSVVRVGK